MEKNRVEAYVEREGLTGEDLTVAAEEIEKAAMALGRCQGAASPKGLLELLAEYLREECMAFAVPEQKPDVNECEGIEIEPGVYSGCNAKITGKDDCPECGHGDEMMGACRRDYDDETETARSAAIRALGYDQKL